MTRSLASSHSGPMSVGTRTLGKRGRRAVARCARASAVWRVPEARVIGSFWGVGSTSLRIGVAGGIIADLGEGSGAKHRSQARQALDNVRACVPLEGAGELVLRRWRGMSGSGRLRRCRPAVTGRPRT